MSVRKVAKELRYDESSLRKRFKGGLGVDKLALKSLSSRILRFVEENNIPSPFNKESELARWDFTGSLV